MDRLELNLLKSDDIRYMLEGLDQLQVPVERHSADSVMVTGQAGPINSPNPSKVEQNGIFNHLADQREVIVRELHENGFAEVVEE